jgi:hypothetical protein
MPYICHGCKTLYPKDSSLRGHLNQRPNCLADHNRFLQRQREATAVHQPPVDPNELDQWLPPDLIDPEPLDDAPTGSKNTFAGRLPVNVEPGLFPDGSNKRTHSGTINRFSLIKAEHRPFPNAAKVIRRNESTPWEVQVSILLLG